MSNKQRTIKNLIKENSENKVYVYLKNEQIGNKFMKMSDAEGFTFSDGVTPVSRDCGKIMAINNDQTINYVGSVGAIAFNSGADEVNGKKLIRVDFEKYISGDLNYYYK